MNAGDQCPGKVSERFDQLRSEQGGQAAQAVCPSSVSEQCVRAVCPARHNQNPPTATTIHEDVPSCAR